MLSSKQPDADGRLLPKNASLSLPLRSSGFATGYDIERDTPYEASTAVASEVVIACGSLAGWLSSARAPRGFGKAEGELGAAAGVYRNAAVAFRSLEDADGDQRRARSNACLALLEQGDHHVDIFAEALAKKLGDAKS